MSRRSVITTILLPVLLISVLVIVLVNNQREFPGELVFAENKVDFGTIPEWEGVVTRSVTARNTGGGTLQIEKIRARCSYAKITGPKLLQPDEEGTFEVVINPQIVPTDATPATAVLFTDSPRTPQVYLTIVASAQRFATLSAEICDFGEILPETMHEKRVKLCVNAPLNLAEVRLMPSTHPGLMWKMSPEPDSTCFHITIQLQAPKKREQVGTESHPGTAENLFSAILTVAFPNERTLTLPIAAKIVRPVTVHPETLSYGAVDRGTEPFTEFTLSAKKGFKVLNLQVPDSVRVAAPDNWTQSLHAYNAHGQQEKRFKVFWEVANSPELLREEIRVLTTADPLPLRIPIYGLIRSTKSGTITSTGR